MGSIRCRTDNSLLFVDFRYLGTRCREQTALPDTSANRKRLQKLLDRIESEITAGTFEYRRFFPNSKVAAKFDAGAQSNYSATAAGASELNFKATLSTPLFKDFAEIWYQEKVIEWRNSYKATISPVRIPVKNRKIK